MSIDGVWYEHEGYAGNNPKSSFRNMLNHGLKQSDRIIVEDCGVSDAYIKRIIKQRVSDGQLISEICVHGRKEAIYKKSKG